MTRASAAHAESCLDDAAWRMSAGGVGRRRRRDAGRRPRRSWTPPLAFLAVAAAVMAAILLTFQHLRTERESALRDAAHEVGMRATILADELNAALQSAPETVARRRVPQGARRRSERAAADGGADRPQRTDGRRRPARRRVRRRPGWRASGSGRTVGRRARHRRSRRRPLRGRRGSFRRRTDGSSSPLRSRRISPPGGARRP